MKELWQWVTWGERNAVATFLTQVGMTHVHAPPGMDLPRKVELCAYKGPVHLAELPHPLIFGMSRQQHQLLQQPLAGAAGGAPPQPTLWQLRLVLRKADEAGSAVLPPDCSPVHALALVNDCATCLADVAQSVGFALETCAPRQDKSGGAVVARVHVPSRITVGDALRGLCLLRAAVEYYACVRGLRLTSAAVQLPGLSALHVDGGLLQRLTETSAASAAPQSRKKKKSQ
ncbi:MAG: hypothetical protein AAF471_05155 [Myxococcota bacterium]